MRPGSPETEPSAGSTEEDRGAAPVLVLAVGNILLGDDGCGQRVLAELATVRARWGSAVELVDGGTQGMALLGLLSGRRAVVVLDAVRLGAAPGTVHHAPRPGGVRGAVCCRPHGARRQCGRIAPERGAARRAAAGSGGDRIGAGACRDRDRAVAVRGGGGPCCASSHGGDGRPTGCVIESPVRLRIGRIPPRPPRLSTPWVAAGTASPGRAAQVAPGR